jgi:hypothetical protein
MIQRLAILLASIALWCILLLGILNCSDSQSPQYGLDKLVARANPTDIKILIVGIDGATFDVINPLIAEGKLPQIRKLIKEGAHGVLKSEMPSKSPSLWTSIATGRGPQEHGITSHWIDKNAFNRFLTNVGITGRSGGIKKKLNRLLKKIGIRQKVLANSNHRKISALWNWMGPFGKTAGFCGWWATWPSEPVNGWIISDRVTRNRFAEWSGKKETEKLTYLRNLILNLEPLIVDPADPPMDEINALVKFSEDELLEFHGVNKPIFAHSLSVFKFAYCSQRSYENFALHMLRKRQPDLTGVFLIANDPISHTFWHFYEPHKFEDVNPEKAHRLGKLLPNFWGHNDRFLAELLTKINSDTVVMVISDHGFQASGIVPKPVSSKQYDKLVAEAIKNRVVAVGQSGKHHENGILIAWGPPIKRGVKVNASLYDIAPTVLALMGLPVPNDMKGRVLTEMIDQDFLARHPIENIGSFEDYIDREQLAVLEEVNEDESLEKLRSLGYVK